MNAMLVAIAHKQGLLLGRMQALGFDLQLGASLTNLTNDIVKSSAIEGELLNEEEVRFSVAQRLGIEIAGLPKSSRHIDGIVKMILDATQNYSSPLTKARLCNWHAGLFPTGHSGMQPINVGHYRPASTGAMQVVSGAYGREKVHFEAMKAEKLEDEMNRFLQWLADKNNHTHPIIQSAIAHLWFVTIHPFEDGNGRIGRAISDLCLSRSVNSKVRFYSLSNQIELERKKYYSTLEQQQRGDTDITSWVEWFISCFARCLENAEEDLDVVLYKAKLWQHTNKQTINDRQRITLNRMLDNFVGFMSTSKYAKIAKCSNDTALRDIRGLVACGILYQNQGGGRSTNYRLATTEELIS